jgi:sterol desaturase/sphingolipid hydroxylase (fatty acid hydroxylase superfamily)
MRALASWAVFPVMFGGALAAALWAMSRGAPPPSVMLPIFLASAALVALVERLLPYRAEWNRARGDLLADATYLPASFLIYAALGPLVAVLAVAGGGWLSRTAGAGLWPAHWPVLAQLPLAIVIAEFFDYWAHRVMHGSPWLWRLHATHHSAPRLYWLNATRAHPLEIAFRGLWGTVPLAVLGAGEPVLALAAVAAMVAGLFQHANIDFQLGPLSWVFSIGELHRWHHSRALREADHNYGNSYIFWDAVFGTRYLPGDRRAPAQIGIEGLDAFPSGLLGQLLSPLRWSRIQRASAALAPAAIRDSL